MVDSRGKVNVKVFCERDESLSGGRPRDSVARPRHRIPRNGGEGGD